MPSDWGAALRAAAIDDLDAISAVWFAGWRETHLGQVPDALLAHRTPEQFRARVPEILDATTVATVAGRVVGLLVVRGSEVEQLYVADGHRGTGIASALLRHGERVIADRFVTAFLAVVAGNGRARRFYEREGWHDTGPFDYEAWTSTGERVAVRCRRYEKDVAAAGCGCTTPIMWPAGPARR